MQKLHICGITKCGEEKNLRELLAPLYPYYDALNWVFHLPVDEGYEYLKSIKKDGKIQTLEFCNRLDFSRNHYLFNGTMQTGDWMIFLDDVERLYPVFFENWKELKNILDYNNIDGCVLHGKRFLYRYSEYLEHRGNPHEGVSGAKNVIELTSLDKYKDITWFFGSVRNINRDKYHFVAHYLKYYCYPNSNHCLLGCESDIPRFHNRQRVRHQFRQYCEQIGVLPMTPEKFQWLCANKMSEIRDFINKEKILNDAYRYFFLNKKDFNDDHDYNNIIVA